MQWLILYISAECGYQVLVTETCNGGRISYILKQHRTTSAEQCEMTTFPRDTSPPATHAYSLVTSVGRQGLALFCYVYRLLGLGTLWLCPQATLAWHSSVRSETSRVYAPYTHIKIQIIENTMDVTAKRYLIQIMISTRIPHLYLQKTHFYYQYFLRKLPFAALTNFIPNFCVPNS